MGCVFYSPKLLVASRVARLKKLITIILYAGSKRKWYNTDMIHHIENTTKKEVAQVIDATPVEKPKMGVKKLDTPLKMKVLAMMARGEKYGTIVHILKDEHGIDYTPNGLTSLRNTHKEVITQMEEMILDAQASESEQIRVKSLRQLSRKLDKANEDEQALDALDAEYREDDEMTLAEYRRRKAGLLKMSVSELVLISKEMHAQNLKIKGPVGAAGLTNEAPGGADPKFVEALMSAIQRGDTIALQQMVINPNA